MRSFNENTAAVTTYTKYLFWFRFCRCYCVLTLHGITMLTTWPYTHSWLVF